METTRIPTTIFWLVILPVLGWIVWGICQPVVKGPVVAHPAQVESELFDAGVLGRYSKVKTLTEARTFLVVELAQINVRGADTKLRALYSIFSCNPELEASFVETDQQFLKLKSELERLATGSKSDPEVQEITALWVAGMTDKKQVLPAQP